MTDRLVLGTVQLGMPYGISNKTGKPDFNSACDMIKTAFDQDIACFDTAQAYGDSEEVLGRVFAKLKVGAQVKVYSKLHPRLDLHDEDAVRQSVEDSLRKLNMDQLEGLLLHGEDGIRFWDEGLGNVLRGLVIRGKVKLIGVSFYTPEKALDALDVDGIDMIQVPANIFDRRFEDAGVFRKAQERGKEVFIRSVFLQGLLLMEPEAIPEKVWLARRAVAEFAKLASVWRLDRKELALRYVLSKWRYARVVVGAETAQQVAENVKIAIQDLPQECMHQIDKAFKRVEQKIINPAEWA
ncbi:MAG: aldo/keto reductase [Candidatus Omnitrophota bacterium]|nr:aldo/keto reductase [Candidatus Omnitrophota bacterium]